MGDAGSQAGGRKEAPGGGGTLRTRETQETSRTEQQRGISSRSGPQQGGTEGDHGGSGMEEG